eukprot:CAMPEP_0117438148 /NCGR_PEP_ID=MMETSP0759-20121206/1902_1 /TAXON_ID=63605 /ORGANISM="Percolomonas cosmopolitus, Strain WS" /LENGTH=1424 /DNA_ID=CAMNT_0005229827 /DNA_START=123 /DNA_END=4397 /DNA_ORIENTATION=+
MIHTKISHHNTNSKKQFNAICCHANYLLCCSQLAIYVYHVGTPLGPPSSNTAATNGSSNTGASGMGQTPALSTGQHTPPPTAQSNTSVLQVPLNIISIEDHVQKLMPAGHLLSHQDSNATTPPSSMSISASPSKLLSTSPSSQEHNSPSVSSLNQSITHIHVNSDASFLAVSLSQSFHIYIFKITQTPFKQLKYFAHITEHDSRVTGVQFDGVKDLFSGDDVGLLLHTRINTGMNQLLAKKTKVERIFKQEPIVQIYCDSNSSAKEENTDHRRLLVSNLKRTVIVDRKEQKFRPVGKKERDGPHGACFQLWKKKKYVFASRPGRRIWMSDMDSGTVKSTLKFPAMESAPNLKFELLHPFGGSKFLLAWSMELLVVVDLQKVKVAQVYTDFAPILDVSIHGVYCSILHGRNGDLSVLEYIPPVPKQKPVEEKMVAEEIVAKEEAPKSEDAPALDEAQNADATSTHSSASTEKGSTQTESSTTVLKESARNPPKLQVHADVSNKSHSQSSVSPVKFSSHLRTMSRESNASSETINTVSDEWDDALIVASPHSSELVARSKKRSKKSKKRRRRVVDLESAPITAKSSSPITIQPRRVKDIGPKQPSSSMISLSLTSTFKKYSSSLASKSLKHERSKSSNMSKSIETIVSSNSDTMSNSSSPTNSVLSGNSIKQSLEMRASKEEMRSKLGSVGSGKKDEMMSLDETQEDSTHEVTTPTKDEETSVDMTGSLEPKTAVDVVTEVKHEPETKQSPVKEESAPTVDDTTSSEVIQSEEHERLSAESSAMDSPKGINSILEQVEIEGGKTILPPFAATEAPSSNDKIQNVRIETSPTTSTPSKTQTGSITTTKAEKSPISSPQRSPRHAPQFELLTDNDPLFAELIASLADVMDKKTSFELYNEQDDFKHIHHWMETLVKLIREDRMDQYKDTDKIIKDNISSVVCLWFYEKYREDASQTLDEYLSLFLHHINLDEFASLMHLLHCTKGLQEIFHFQDENRILHQKIEEIARLIHSNDVASASHILKRASEHHPSLIYRFLPQVFAKSVPNAIDLAIAVYPIVNYEDVRSQIFEGKSDSYLTYLIKLHQSRPECHYEETFMHHFVTHLIEQMTAQTMDIDELSQYNHHLTDIIHDVVNRETTVERTFLEQLLLEHELDDQLLNLYKLSGQEEEVIEMFIRTNNTQALRAFMEANSSKENWVALLGLVERFDNESSTNEKHVNSKATNSPSTSSKITPEFIVHLMCTCMPSAQILEILTENDDLLSDAYGADIYRRICQLAEYENQQSRLNHELLESVDSYMWAQKDMPVSTQIRSILDYMPKHLRKSDTSILNHLKHSFGVIHPDTTLNSLRTNFDYSLVPSFIEDCATPWGIMVDARNTLCPSCNLSLTSTETHSRESVIFDCGHAFHKECCSESHMVCGECVERSFSSVA